MSLIGCNAIAFSPCERKRFHRVSKKKEKALNLAAKGISAEIAQLGERQSEDLNVPSSTRVSAKCLEKKKGEELRPHSFSTYILMLLEFTCQEILCFLENDSLKISKKMVLISSCGASLF